MGRSEMVSPLEPGLRGREPAETALSRADRVSPLNVTKSALS